jgi:hypothetical protein
LKKKIKERNALGNKAYYANQKKVPKSKLVSNKAKLKLYWTIIRPVITYASKTLVLKESTKQKLLIN